MDPCRRHSDADQLELACLGHKAELKRTFSPLAMLGLAFAILNSWTALSASLSLALPSGGTVSAMWGLLTAGLCNLCLAASLAEFLSAYPTAGGQYHWVAAISWSGHVPLLSWITGWINVSGWIALVASGGLLGSQLIVGVISLFHSNYDPRPWHQFLIYTAYTLSAFFINAFFNDLLPFVNKAAITWSIAGFFVICIAVLACASPNYASASFVFATFINETGWPDGISWLLGLLQGGLALTGYDAVAHMIEEIPDASTEGPRIMITCVAIGTFTGFVFLTCLLFVSGGNVRSITASPTGPLLYILHNATQNRASSVCLLMFPLICLLFATTSIMTTSSRMTYAFARDGGLPGSRVLAKVHTRLGQPLHALVLTTALTLVFGCIFLGSSSAFNAILSASVVALGVSYAIPIAIHVLRARKMLPSRPFVLPSALGWFANIVGVCYVLVTTVLFLFPPQLPVTTGNMNYCVVAFGTIITISTLQWFVDGKKNFTGPRHDTTIEALDAALDEPTHPERGPESGKPVDGEL